MKIHNNKTKKNNIKSADSKPVKNLETFVTDKSFDLDVEYMLHYLKTDLNSKLTLFRSDFLMTATTDIYGEANRNSRKFLPGIEIYGQINIKTKELENYFETGVVRDDVGELEVVVFEQELNSKDVTINRGDIIVIHYKNQVKRYFEVFDSNNVNISTSQTNIFYKTFFKTIKALPVKNDVFIENLK